MLNVPLANCYKYSPSSQFTEIVYDSFFPFCLLVSNCGSQFSSKAFLFSLVNRPGWAPVKLPQTGQYSSHRHSIYSCSRHGPTFGGGHDIKIASYASSNSNSYSHPGYTYSPPSGHGYLSSFARSFLAGSRNFQPDEVEVFYETTWGKRIPIYWKSRQGCLWLIVTKIKLEQIRLGNSTKLFNYVYGY